MRCAVFYAYPTEPDGTSLQGDHLFKGLKLAGEKAFPCHYRESIQKKFYLRHMNIDVSFGVGFWGNVEEVVRHPQKYGVPAVPWFNADGWVANYQEEFDKLELMFTTSEWVKQTYKRDGVNVNKIVPMHIGIDTDLFMPTNNTNANSAIRKMCNVNDDEQMILTVGGDVTSKGAQEMMRALALANKEFKNWKYVCKSWPSDCASEWREKEEKLAEDLGIRDKVVFMDDEFSQEFMADLVNACDIYAAPSRLEGYGMIQVEAMACGKPVISINKMGPGETIIHNKTGFLAKVAREVKLESEWVYPHMGFDEKKVVKFDSPKTFAYRADVDELKEYALKLMQDKELRERMGQAGRKHSVDNLDYRHIGRKIRDITKQRLKLD
ncbi:glycosyltransferase [Candidatus Woesearchaeota archaeon]|nr:glycosyltransferase [Candidatus Woesearchaeota archaeon]